MARLRSGRHPADHRIQVDPPRSPFFRAGPDGVFVARPAAIEPSDPFGRALSRLRRTMFGRPLSNAEEGSERLSKAKALAVFASDNLSSVAYASEAILFTLLAAGTVTFGLALPISGLIVTVLAIIVVSYRQTIRAYPNGGGSYVVARENLGQRVGLVAGAALLTDYVLTVAVSVAAGVAAITSAFPGLLEGWRVGLAAIGIVVVMLINLRGVRESGTIFAIPTYVFVASMLVLIESLVQPLVRYLEEATTGSDDRFVIVLLPVYAPSNRLERILFNDNGRRIREALLGRERVLVADVPYRRPG